MKENMQLENCQLLIKETQTNKQIDKQTTKPEQTKPLPKIVLKTK